MENLINTAKLKNLDLKKAEIEGILYLLVNEKGLTNTELVRKTGIPKETLKKFKDSIGSIFDTPKDDVILVKEEYLDQLKNLNLAPYKWNLVEFMHKELEEELAQIRKKYSLEPKREYDQFFATIRTSISKALLLKEKGIVGGTILLLGDDDLVSITLGLMQKRGLLTEDFRKIMVVDIDHDILDTIEKIAADLGIENIQTQYYDAREDIPEILKGTFQAVMIDPPYTSSGIYQFLAKSIEFLRKSSDYSGNYIFLCYGNSFKTPEKTLKVQEIISSFNLLVEDKVDKFCRYFGAESIGSASSMYVLKTTPATFIPKIVPSDSIYTYENAADERFPYVEHYVLKIKDVPARYINSQKTLLKVLGDFCRIHQLDVVDTIITRFGGKGLTISYILKQSNLTVHTWPEKNAIHVVVVTCSTVHKVEEMANTFKKLLQTDNVVLSVVK